MIIFPNAKINLGLRVSAKRADGYHDIESVFFPLKLRDILEFVVNENISSDSLHQSGITSGCTPEENLVIKAIKLLRKDHLIPPLNIHLHKLIPIGAGLGGGSSDAAFMLRYLNRHFKLGISSGRLTEYAIRLGSDCAFFIKNQPAIARGRGEKLKETQLKLKGLYLMLVHPNLHVSTAKAYSLITPHIPETGIEEIIASPVESWRNRLVNDFEEAIIKLHPEIGAIKDKMYSSGAVYSSMTGSGSAVFGLFKSRPSTNLAGSYWSWIEKVE